MYRGYLQASSTASKRTHYRTVRTRLKHGRGSEGNPILLQVITHAICQIFGLDPLRKGLLFSRSWHLIEASKIWGK